MSDRFLADALVLVDLLFIVLVLFGGLLVLRWRTSRPSAGEPWSS